MTQGLPRRIKLAFIMQAVLGSIVITAAIVAAGLLVRHVILAGHLQREADVFWTGRAASPAHPLPRSSVVAGYLDPATPGDRSAPRELRELGPGRHQRALPGAPGKMQVLLVDRRPQGTLYLTLDSTHIDRAILLTGMVSLLVSLLAIYLVSWLTYRTSKRLVGPVSWLADAVAQWDPRDPDASAIKPGNLPVEAGNEVRHLSSALVGLADRVADFVQRERDFTRDASHELRTPLTVIRVATDLMLTDPDTSARSQRSLMRVQRAGHDMEAVIDAFLILAREAEVAPQSESLDVAEIIHDEIERARPLLAGKPVELVVVDEGVSRMMAPPRVLNVMLGNLLSNAVRFTEEGRIEVRAGPDRIEVRDSGIGMSTEVLAKVFNPFYRVDIARDEGKGMGLSIVRRLGERFGWPVELYSAEGRGTTAIVRFDSAARRPA